MVAYIPEEASAAALRLGGAAWLVKAQVSPLLELLPPHTAGTPEAVAAAAAELLSQQDMAAMARWAPTATRVYVEPALQVERSFALSIGFDRKCGGIVCSARDGGQP